MMDRYYSYYYCYFVLVLLFSWFSLDLINRWTELFALMPHTKTRGQHLTLTYTLFVAYD